MVTGQKHRIPRGNAIVEYTEYKLQPSDAGKGLKQIARERLNDENLYKDILQMTGTPNTQGISWYQEIEPKDRIGNNWTLLLPPARPVSNNPASNPSAQLGTFKLTQETNIRTSPRVEAANIFLLGRVGTQYTYLTNSKITDQAGMTWVEVAASNFGSKAIPGARYYICVREGNLVRTNPAI
ncbi:MAG: hypothetical protein OHK003_31070 [Anaerolineales bacterium]